MTTCLVHLFEVILVSGNLSPVYKRKIYNNYLVTNLQQITNTNMYINKIPEQYYQDPRIAASRHI